MSADQVELVRAVYAAWERDDIAFILEHSDPEIVIVQPPEVPDAKSYRGHEGVVQSFQDWPSQWEEFRAELIEVIDVDEDRVISVNRQNPRSVRARSQSGAAQRPGVRVERRWRSFNPFPAVRCRVSDPCGRYFDRQTG